MSKMTNTSPAATVGLVTRLLREAFEGPPGPWTYFTDTAPGHGVFATLGGLTAVEASETGGPGGSTIAGHVHHLSASLGLTMRGLRGEVVSRDRSKSWTVSAVDAAQWTELQTGLRRAYDTLRVAIETHAEWDEETLGTAFGAIAHAAYHLGAIRQRLTPE